MSIAEPAALATAEVLERQCDLYCRPQNGMLLSWQVACLTLSSAQLRQHTGMWAQHA